MNFVPDLVSQIIHQLISGILTSLLDGTYIKAKLWNIFFRAEKGNDFMVFFLSVESLRDIIVKNVESHPFNRASPSLLKIFESYHFSKTPLTPRSSGAFNVEYFVCNTGEKQETVHISNICSHGKEFPCRFIHVPEYMSYDLSTTVTVESPKYSDYIKHFLAQTHTSHFEGNLRQKISTTVNDLNEEFKTSGIPFEISSGSPISIHPGLPKSSYTNSSLRFLFGIKLDENAEWTRENIKNMFEKFNDILHDLKTQRDSTPDNEGANQIRKESTPDSGDAEEHLSDVD